VGDTRSFQTRDPWLKPRRLISIGETENEVDNDGHCEMNEYEVAEHGRTKQTEKCGAKKCLEPRG
jgi:hypothetical protein